MDAVLLGSSAKPSSLPTGSFAAVQVSRCKAWNILERYYAVKLQQRLMMHHLKYIEGRSTLYQRCKSKVNAASEHHPIESEPGACGPETIWELFKNAVDAFYRFSRPHTVIGTALSIISVSLLAVKKLSDISPLFFTGVLEAVVAALFMNIYIVGLNQLSDIDIDKVNKPYLPLASGEYSVGTGVMIVTSFSIMSFWLGWVVGSWPLFWALFISFVLGTAYSIDLPLLRWKRSAFVAAMCILAVRAVIVQLAFFLHMQTHVYRRPVFFSRPLIFATAFMSFFSVVIALFKDIPDIDGDKIFGIRSFTVRMGQKRVFWICISLLEMAYGVSILVGAMSPFLWSKFITEQDRWRSTGRASERNSLYYLEDQSGRTRVENPLSTSFLSESVMSNKNKIWLYHRRLGHPSFNILKLMFPSLCKGSAVE